MNYERFIAYQRLYEEARAADPDLIRDSLIYS